MQLLAGDALGTILFRRTSRRAEAAKGAATDFPKTGGGTDALLCFVLRIDGPCWRADDRRAGRVFDGSCLRPVSSLCNA